MSSGKKFQEEVRSCDGAGITKEVYLSGNKYILFTRLPQDEDLWVVGVTDGQKIWTTELTEENLNDRRGTSTLKEISDALRNGDFQLFNDTPKLSLTVLRKLNWSLEHPSDAQVKTEMNSLLFSLFDKLQDATVKLRECESALSRARSAAAATAAGAGGLGDLVSTGSSGKTAASKQKRIKGASIVNPSSKRRKAATGVVYDADS